MPVDPETSFDSDDATDSCVSFAAPACEFAEPDAPASSDIEEDGLTSGADVVSSQPGTSPVISANKTIVIKNFFFTLILSLLFFNFRFKKTLRNFFNVLRSISVYGMSIPCTEC